MAIVITKQDVLAQQNQMFHTYPTLNALMDHFKPKGEEVVLMMCAVNATLQMVADNMQNIVPDNALLTPTNIHANLAHHAKHENVEFNLSVNDIPMDTYDNIVCTESSLRDEHEHEEDAAHAADAYYDEILLSLNAQGVKDE